MYERSASVLEKYIGKTLIYSSELKENYSYYKDLIALLENYQIASEREITYEKEYKMVLSKVEDIQRKQREISKYNIELENKRNRLFNDSARAPEEILSQLIDIEKILKSNLSELEELRVELIEYLKTLNSKKPILKDLQDMTRLENRKFRKALRDATDSYRVITSEQLEWLEVKLSDYEKLEDEAIAVMLRNGKDERVPFNEEAIRSATIFGIDIARKQYEAYIFIYRQTSKLMEEINANKVKLDNRKKILIATDAKIKFLEAEKEYLNHFLDNERLTAIHSVEEHDKNMNDAIKKFNFDIDKIHSLYNLLLKSTKGKSTREDFKLLYDASHYRNVEEKELNFQRETRRLGIGVAVSPDYWRREGLRSIYDMFSRIIYVIEAKKIAKNQINVERIDTITNKLAEKVSQEDEFETDKIYGKEVYNDKDNEEDYNETDNEQYDEEEDYDETDNKQDELLKEEYKYKERIKRLLEQNNIKGELEEYEFSNKIESNNYDEDSYEDDEEDNDDEEDDDDNDEDVIENEENKSSNDDTKYGKHSIEDSKRRGRHSHSDTESQKTNIFGKLKNMFDKNKEDEEDDDDEDDDEDFSEEESDNYEVDEYNDADENMQEDNDISKKEKDEESERIRRYEERMNRFEEKMRIKLSENPKLRR